MAALPPPPVSPLRTRVAPGNPVLASPPKQHNKTARAPSLDTITTASTSQTYRKSLAPSAASSSEKSTAPSVFSASSVTSPSTDAPLSPTEKSVALLTIKDLYAIVDQAAVLTDALKNVKPGPVRVFGALGCLPHVQKLDSLLQKAKSLAQDSGPFTESGSFAIVGVSFQLQEGVDACVDALVAACHLMSTCLFGSGKLIVRHSIARLRASAKELGDVVIAQMDPFVHSIARVIVRDIDDQFARGYAAYR